MSTSIKFIIPLLNKTLTLEDIDKDCGFVDMYTRDINKPQLDNHIFFMYDADISKVKNFNRHKKFISDKNLHSYYNYIINGKAYVIYVYSIFNMSIRMFKKTNLLTFTDEEKLRMLNFWGNTDIDINLYLTNSNYTKCEFERDIIPERDFLVDTYNAKTRGLTILSTLGFCFYL